MDAIENARPVVALESSVLAQGLPIPANADADRRMRAAVESRGAVPAITAIVRGVPTIGLDGADLERFLRRDGVRKVSARDMAAAVTARADGATTVAAALTLSHLAGVDVFATGGIGGVHRRMASDLAAAVDESADLLELARTPIVVVCAGAKSILDLPATWERLETLGIPVVGFQTDSFPGFYTRDTGLPLCTRATTAADVVALFRAHRALGRPQALLVVQPPPDAFALEADVVETATAAALAEADRRGVRGAAVTPFLLEAISRSTEGRSLAANLALLERNAMLAAEIAVLLRE